MMLAILNITNQESNIVAIKAMGPIITAYPNIRINVNSVVDNGTTEKSVQLRRHRVITVERKNIFLQCVVALQKVNAVKEEGDTLFHGEISSGWPSVA